MIVLAGVAGGEGFCFVKVAGLAGVAGDGRARGGVCWGWVRRFAEFGDEEKAKALEAVMGLGGMEIEERSFVAALLWMTAKCG